MKVAVVGSGVSGLVAARALARQGHHVAIFESAARAGGHVYTFDAGGVGVDMGFIVMNRENYPHLTQLFAELGVATRPTTMSFSVSAGGLEWGSASLRAVFAQRARLASMRHWRFLGAVLSFLRAARADLGGDLAHRASLDDYLAARRVPADVRELFVVPLAAALWSLAPERCGEFPAETYLRFLANHGMLRPVRPLDWRTVIGGSHRYVAQLLAELRAPVRLSSAVETIARDKTGVTIVVGGRESRFDRAIVATHADTALRLLAQPSDDEREILGAFRYSSNETVLHTDESFLPSAARARASWNVVADADPTRVAVTYSMDRLMGLDRPYLVTLNPRRAPAGELHRVRFDHPQFDRAALDAQAAMPRISGVARVYYAGAHLGFGFHEDGARTGLAAAARLAADAQLAGEAA
ncbi:MAG TPA: FAD-dependent oxidoreductase [Kofleriaceae bacterium]|nr:FAD-dependent oxidoreductase [Kofleriaceae bacterium]